MIQGVIHFFDRLEDRVRIHLSHYPIIYAFIGGIGIALFWRGAWMMADELQITSIESLIAGTIILLMTGLFVSFFIGEEIILTGIKREKKFVERTEEEVRTERDDIADIRDDLEKIMKKLESAKK